MHRSMLQPVLATVLVMLLVAPAASLAQEPAGPFPAAIVSGTCGAPGEEVAPLSDASADFPVDGEPSVGSLPVGTSGTVPVTGSATTVSVALADLVAADHHLSVAASADDATVIACGDVGGRTIGDGDLPVALAPVGEAGSAGVAILRDAGDGSTSVTVYLVPAGGAATGPVPTGTQSVTLGNEMWFAGFGVTVRGATFDPETRTVTVDVLLDNEAGVTRTTAELARSIFLGHDGQQDLMRVDSTQIPAGTTGVTSFTVGNLDPETFVLADAVFTMGDGSQHQATQPLAEGAEPTFTAPRDVRMGGTIRLPGLARFSLFDARVIPADCAGNVEGITFRPLALDQESIVVTVREVGLARLGVLARAFITGPGGLSFQADPGFTSIARGQTNQGNQWCFTVAAPVEGEYRLTFEGGDRRASRTFTIPPADAGS